MNAARRKKPTWGDVFVALIVLVLAFGSLFALPKPHGNGLSVHVTVDGDEVWSCALEKLTESTRYELEGKYPLILEVTDEGVRVIESSCPGEDCVHVGMISKAGQQIVCLPNRTVITLQGDTPAYDAVTG